MQLSQVQAFLTQEKPDAVIHAAAHYGGIGINHSHPADLFFVNAVMAANLFEAAARAGVPKIVPVGSACAYPGHLQGDLEETHFWDGRCHDSVEAYGFSKRLQVVGLTAYHKQYGMAFNHLILTNMYGEWDAFDDHRSHVVAALLRRFLDAQIHQKPEVICWGDGSPIRDFIYAGDAAEAVVRALPMDHDPEPMNVGTGQGTSIRELVNTIIRITGYQGRVTWDTSKPSGVPRKVLSVKRMRTVLNWTPSTPLAEGLTRTLAWLRTR